MFKMFWILFVLLLLKGTLVEGNQVDFKKDYAAMRKRCFNDSKNRISNKKGIPTCPVKFIGECFPETYANVTVIRPCSEFFFYPIGNISKRCNASGHWEKPNITFCVRLPHQATSKLYDPEDLAKQRTVFVVVSWISISIMVPSLLFTVYLLRGRNERFNVHINLILAFILRTTTFFIHYYGELQNPGNSVVLCNIFWSLNRYFAAAEITWMLNEALVLLRKVVIIFDKKPYLRYYLLIGWGSPFVLITAVYVPIMVSFVDKPPKSCWSNYKDSLYMLVLYVPLALVLMINFFTLIYTVAIFVKRQKTTPQDEFLKIRKAIKGTLILSPLLGVIYLLIFFHPDKTPVWYKYFLRMVYPMQGTLACLVYITFSGELRNKMKLQYRSSVQGRRSLMDNGYYSSVSRAARNADKTVVEKISHSSTSPSVDPQSCPLPSPSPSCDSEVKCGGTGTVVSIPEEEPCVNEKDNCLETTEL